MQYFDEEFDEVDDHTLERWIIGIAVLFTLFFAAVALSSCGSEKHVIKKIAALSSRANDAVRKACTTMFPPEVSVVHDTTTNTVIQMRDGIPTVLYSSVDCDSAIKAAKGARARVPCPPSIYRVDTMIVTHTINNNTTYTVVDRNKEKMLQADLDKMTADRDELKKKRNHWRLACLACGLIIVVLVFRKFIGGRISSLAELFKKK